jgi:serralysin
MTGVSKTVVSVGKSTLAQANGVLSGYAWSGTITYAFPTSASDYSYTSEASDGFAAITSSMQTTALFAMEQSDGNTANDGFSIEGFTNATFESGSTTTSTIRIAQSDKPSTAYAYYPTTAAQGGDVWFGTNYDYTAPQAGNYAWHTMLHELGHALGLKHPHEKEGTFGLMAATYDDVEYTVMSYKAYVGAKLTGYTYSTWSAPQTYMMADIAALQHMYGADYTTNSGDTTYSWSASSGDTYVDGVLAIDAGSSTIFATIWDGGGTDTYDLSAYSSALSINLAPGSSSSFSSSQLATLGTGKYAKGNIYNALLYNNNTASMIENATGGSGNDTISGNILANVLTGNAGIDKLLGLDGNDTLYGNAGADTIDGGNGDDAIYGGADADTITGGLGNDTIDGGDGANTIKDTGGNDTITGGADADYISASIGDDVISGSGGDDKLYAGAGNDTVYGGAGADAIWGEAGNNILYGDAGNDSIVGNSGLDSIYGGDDADYITGVGGNDIVYGGAGNDTLYGGIGNDTIYGGADADKIYGDAGNNLLYGEAGTDTITGNAGIDTIYGGDDADYILGLAGNDFLYGDAGGDTISGGVGNDSITGGDGADVFVFESLTAIGKDIITDFDLTADYVKFGVSTMADLFISKAKQVGENTVVTFSSAASITLLDFDVTEIGDVLIAA